MIIGITGSVGTGKSTVSKLFEKKGSYRIDADQLAREAVEKGRSPYRAVVRFFGKEILHRDGSIDRGKLARIVFKNQKKLNTLNGFIHPYVIRRIKEKIRQMRRRQKNPYIVVEVPLLHEAHLTGMFDKVVTVSCREGIQRRRWVRQRRRLENLLERKRRQLPLSYKKKHSDFFIDNNRSLQQTKTQVAHIWKVIHRI